MKLIISLCLVLLFASALSATWYEQVEAHVVDSLNRPLKGAVVSVLYQKNNFPITEETLDGSFNMTTNESGKLILSFSNNVDNPAYETRYYVVKALYSGQEKSEKITCGSLGSKCHDNLPFLKTFSFSAYRINIKVQDQNGEPIEDAQVSFDGQEYRSDASGSVWVSAIDGKKYTAVVEYAGKKRTFSGSVHGADVNEVAIIPRYDVRLRIIDDYGSILQSDVMLNGESKHTDDAGYVSFQNVISDNVEIILRNAGGFRQFNLSLYDNVDMEVVLDGTPPTISQVSKKVDAVQKAVFISAAVIDPGSKASGLRTVDPLRFRYKAGNDGWKSIQMYQIGKDAFQATIPLEYDTPINYEIEAFDEQGNENIYAGNFTVESGVTVKDNETISENVTATPTDEKGGVDVVTLIAGVLIAVVILLLLYKKYTGEI